MTKTESLKHLQRIPGVGPSIAHDLWRIGVRQVSDLRGTDPLDLYQRSNNLAGCAQDKCLLDVFRCAVYFAETPGEQQDPERLKWWNWKDCVFDRQAQ